MLSHVASKSEPFIFYCKYQRILMFPLWQHLIALQCLAYCLEYVYVAEISLCFGFLRYFFSNVHLGVYICFFMLLSSRLLSCVVGASSTFGGVGWGVNEKRSAMSNVFGFFTSCILLHHANQCIFVAKGSLMLSRDGGHSSRLEVNTGSIDGFLARAKMAIPTSMHTLMSNDGVNHQIKSSSVCKGTVGGGKTLDAVHRECRFQPLSTLTEKMSNHHAWLEFFDFAFHCSEI